MVIIVDLLLLAIVIYFLIMGIRRGFMRTLLSFVSKIASVMLAYFISDKYDELIYETFFKESIISNIEEKLASSPGGEVSQQISDLLTSVPESVSALARALGIDFLSLGESLSASGINGEVSAFVEQILSGPAVFICGIIIFAIAYAVITFVFNILINLLCKIVKLPILKTADKALGGALGLFNGFITVLILSYVCVIASAFINNPQFSEIINNSQIIEILTSTMNGFIGV